MTVSPVDDQTLTYIATAAACVASTALLCLVGRCTTAFRRARAFPLNELPKDVIGLIREFSSPETNGILAQACVKQAEFARDLRPKEWDHIAALIGIGGEENRIERAQKKYREMCDVIATDGTIDPKTALPAEVHAEYQRIYDHALQVLGDEIAERLGLPSFPNAEAVRVWFADPTNLPAIQGINELDLSGRELAVLPREIGQLVNLRSLRLSQNNLITLPAEIGQLTNLDSLSLIRNHLTALPREIGQLVNLQCLMLSRNNLITLPAEIGQLTDLDTLLLAENHLTTLPAKIGQLVNLRFVLLVGNPLTSLPPTLHPRLFECGLLTPEKIAELQAAWVEEEEDGGGAGAGAGAHTAG